MAWVQKKANWHKIIQMKDNTDIEMLKSIHTAWKSFKVLLIAVRIKLNFIRKELMLIKRKTLNSTSKEDYEKYTTS